MTEHDLEIGKLISSVKTLELSVNRLTNKVASMEQKYNTGRGILMGLILAAGSLGGSVGAGIDSYISHIGK